MPLLVAIAISWATYDVVRLAAPLQSEQPIRLVYVCCIQKDQSRIMPSNVIAPVPVRTERFVAADISPAQQAAGNRKRKR